MTRRCPSCQTSFPDEVFFCGNDGTITIQEQDPADHDPRLGTRLGGYLVVARVADGAMGRVYEGRHPETREQVAIKALHAPVALDPVAVERFKREYETANEFGHPHIVKVLEYGETPDGSYFLTMEYLKGVELSHALRSGAMPIARALRIASQVALGLDHAHSFGVIHRDLKPDNIFLCQTDEGDMVRILDFGSVKLQMEMGPKLTAFGTTLGSPYYMSPEQAMGKSDVDQRTDVFAVAAILFEMCSGRIAFEGNGVAEILMKIVNGEPPLLSTVVPTVPPALDGVIDRGLRKDKTERYSSASELAQAFGAALGLTGGPVEWAKATVAEIEAALAASRSHMGAEGVSGQASPPAVSAPRGGGLTAPQGGPGGALAPLGTLGDQGGHGARPGMAGQRSAVSPLVILGLLAVGGVVMVGGLLVLWWLLR